MREINHGLGVNKVTGKLLWEGGGRVSRLIQNKLFRILRDAERICVWVFKEYIVKFFFSKMHIFREQC